MNLGGNKTDKKQDSSGIFSKMKALLAGKKNKTDDGAEYVQEKETLKKYKDVLKREDEVKQYQSAKKEENTNSDSIIKKESKIAEKKKSSPEQVVKEKKEKVKQTWSAPEILKTNLAKGEQTIYVDWNKKIKKLSFMGALSCFFVFVVYAGLIVWGMNTKSKGKILDSDIDLIKSQLLTYVSDVQEIDDFYGKLKNVNLLLDKHIYWTNVFEFVEKNTFSDVQISGGISGDPRSEYIFSVLTDNFTTLNQQVRFYKEQDEVIDAQFEGGSFQTINNEDGQTVSTLITNIDIQLQPEIFFKK